MILGVTHCLSCTEELELSSMSDDRPLATITQTCSGCDRDHDGIVVFYPDNDFTLVGKIEEIDDSIDEQYRPPKKCDCRNEITVGTVRASSGRQTVYCRECVPAHYGVIFDR